MPSVRQARRRAHLRGDHRLCGPKCLAGRVQDAVDAAERPGTVSAAVAAFAETVSFPPSDPRSVTLACATALAELVDAGVAPVLASGQVSTMVAALGRFPGDGPSPLDTARARVAAKQVELAVAFSDKRKGDAS
ncbi:MAG: hypothetical protein ACLQDY_08330 [Streptosporangiaceae bacterium]